MPLDNVESPLMFTVTEKPIRFWLDAGGAHEEIEGWKALVRRHPATGAPVVLHVAKDTYKIVQNKDLYGEIDKTVLANAGEHSQGVIINDRMSYLGAFCSRQYVFPNMKCEIEQRSSSTSVGFRIVANTSFDGSSSIKMLSGAIDFYCTNGMIRGEFDQLVQRHTSAASTMLPRLADRLKASIDVFWKQADALRKWAKIETTGQIAEEVIAKFGFSESRVKAIRIRFEYEAAKRGPTVWALYSALTYYASHNSDDFGVRDTGRDNVAATLQKRELEVFRLTNSNEWRALAA